MVGPSTELNNGRGSVEYPYWVLTVVIRWMLLGSANPIGFEVCSGVAVVKL